MRATIQPWLEGFNILSSRPLSDGAVLFKDRVMGNTHHLQISFLEVAHTLSQYCVGTVAKTTDRSEVTFTTGGVRPIQTCHHSFPCGMYDIFPYVLSTFVRKIRAIEFRDRCCLPHNFQGNPCVLSPCLTSTSTFPTGKAPLPSLMFMRASRIVM